MIITLLGWKIISIVSLIVGVYLFGFAPLVFGNSIDKAYISLLSSFSGGVLIGTTFIHLFPEVVESADKFRCAVGIKSTYPIGELLICVGLIAVMIIENMVEEYEQVVHHHSHTHKEEEEEEEEYDEGVRLVDTRHCHDDTANKEHTPHSHVDHFTLGEHGGWGAYIMVVALSVHSILEGVAIGLAETPEATVTLFLSVIIHEVCLAFALGLKLFQDNHSIKQFIISLSVFVISCPVGVGIGMFVLGIFSSLTLTKIVFVLKALATGTFIQVTFFEILAPEFSHRYTNQLFKMAALTLGLIFISVIMYEISTPGKMNFCKQFVLGHH